MKKFLLGSTVAFAVTVAHGQTIHNVQNYPACLDYSSYAAPLPCIGNVYTPISDTSHSVMRTNSVFVELAGSGLAYSFNYERLFYKKVNNKFSTRIGISFFDRAVAIPATVSQMFGRKNNFEYGIGVSPIAWSAKEAYVLFSGLIAYRYISKGFMFRVASTPMVFRDKEMGDSTSLFPYYKNWYFIPSIGISVGYLFYTHRTR